MKILIVVDMQNDFIDGALGTFEAVMIVPRVCAKIDDYLEKSYPVVYTRDTHSGDYPDTQEGRLLPVTHCIKGTPGWEIADAVFRENCYILDKPSFGSMELPALLGDIMALYPEDEPELIELIGLCTDICVISNALIVKAAFPEIPIAIDSGCCAGVTPESHENALRAMRSCQINIV